LYKQGFSAEIAAWVMPLYAAFALRLISPGWG
jgi:hypothetical protein